jgi:hypothetical protein
MDFIYTIYLLINLLNLNIIFSGMTKIKINFEDENLLTKTPKSFKVKELLDLLYKTLKINDKQYRLDIFTRGNFLNQSDTLTPDENQQFYVIRIEEQVTKTKPTVDTTIDKLIRDTTGANYLLKPGPIQREREIEGSFMAFLQANGFRLVSVDNGNSSSDDSEEDERVPETRDVSRLYINRMLEMGMDEQRAIYCLYHARNNVEAAINFYFASSQDNFEDIDSIISLVNIVDGEPRQNIPLPNQQRRIVIQANHVPLENPADSNIQDNNANQNNQSNPFLAGLNRQNQAQGNMIPSIMNFLMHLMGDHRHESDDEENV